MNPLTLLLDVWVPLLAGAEETHAPEDYKAGWLGFAVFVALAVAVALLMISLTRHLRKARDNADQGVFDGNDKPRRNSN